MKKTFILAGLMATVTAQATLFQSGTINVGAVLPDGNPAGYVSSYMFNTGGDLNLVNGVSVTLNLSGGYNGDLYGYLVNPNGNMAVLLNRVGQTGGNYGYSDSGMNVILSEAAMMTTVGGIHTYQTVGGYDITSGTTGWTPDNLAGDFTALHTGAANGTWTLFLADLSTGDQSTLVSWGLSVSVVPEPATWALMIFSALAGGWALARRLRRSAVL